MSAIYSRTYHGNPSFQSSVPLELVALVGLEDEFVVESGERDAMVGIKVAGILGQAGLDTFWGGAVVGHCEIWGASF